MEWSLMIFDDFLSDFLVLSLSRLSGKGLEKQYISLQPCLPTLEILLLRSPFYTSNCIMYLNCLTYSYVASKAVEDSTFSVSEIKRKGRFDRFDGTGHVEISAKHLIDGLLPLIISTAHASTSLSSNGINLINENDAGRLLLACQIFPGGDSWRL